MSSDDNNDKKSEAEKFIIKCFHTVVLTALTAMVLGVFSFLGWLGSTVVDIKTNQQKIIKELSIQETEKNKLANELIKEAFKTKEKIAKVASEKEDEDIFEEDSLDEEIAPQPPQPISTIDVEAAREAEDKRLELLEKERIESEKQERFMKYKESFQQKIQVPREHIQEQLKEQKIK